VKYLFGSGTRWPGVERGFEEKLVENEGGYLQGLNMK